MKVLIYDKNTRHDEFTNRGYGTVRDIKSCKVIEELNGRYEVELVVYLTDSKVNYFKKWAILSVNGQLFRVNSVKKTDKDETVTLIAKHIFYDLDFGFIEDRKPENVTMQEALTKAIPEGFEHFTASSDIEDKNTRYLVKENGVGAVFNIMDRWGKGELFRDNFTFSVNESRGKDSGVTFTYKKIDGIELLEETDDIVTRLYPTGFDGISLAEKYIYIPNWNEEDYLPFHITREVYFEDAKNEGDLRILAKKEAEKIGASRCNIKVSVLDLLNTELYDELRDLMYVSVGDIVTIKHDRFDIRYKAKVIKKEEEIVTGAVVVELGEAISTFVETVTNNNSQSVEAVNIDTTSLRNELFYYFNGMAIPFKQSKEQQLASMRIATSETTNLMCHISINPNITKSGLLKLRITINNEDIQYSPLINLPEGYSVQTISVPFIAVDGGQTKVVKLWGLFDGEGQIDMNCLHMSITGQNIAMGLIKIEPFTGAFIEYDYEHIPKLLAEVGTMETTLKVSKNTRHNKPSIVEMKHDYSMLNPTLESMEIE